MIYFSDFGTVAGDVSSGGVVTFNAFDKHADISLSGGGLIATKSGTDAHRSVRATFGRSATGNGYFEIYVTSNNMATNPSASRLIGLSNWAVGSADLASTVGDDAGGWSYYEPTGQKFTNNVGSAYGSSYTNNDTIGVALKNGKVWFSKNGVWIGDPVAGTGEAFSGLTGTLYPTVSLLRATNPWHVVHFRGASYNCVYTAPTGIGYWER